MEKKRLSEIVDEARNNVEQRGMYGNNTTTYNFGSSNNFGFGDKYWTEDRRKIKTFRFIHDLFK